MSLDTSQLDAQIAALQAEKQRQLKYAERTRHDVERKRAETLIPTTPTKPLTVDEKRNPWLYKRISSPTTDLPTSASIDDGSDDWLSGPASTSNDRSAHLPASAIATSSKRPVLPSVPAQSAASKMSSSLAALRKAKAARSDLEPSRIRSSSFYTSKSSSDTKHASPHAESSKAAQASFAARQKAKSELAVNRASHSGARLPSPDLEVDDPGPMRDGDDLTIIESLELGPKDHGKDPEGEEVWEHFEPNSRLRLSKRAMSHEILQDHLRGRYFLPPSLLYSVIRLSRDGATYDVPVEGDWVTIAVVAERSDVRVSGTKEAVESDSEDEVEEEGKRSTKKKQGDKEKSEEEKERDNWKKRRGPRKFINLRLASLPSRASSLGDKAPSGAAMLQLLLFEADAKIRKDKNDQDESDEERERSRTTYQGGSGGAYEKWCNLTEGSVVALLNPRVLRPLRSGGQAPHPLTLPLALNPTSADSVFVIGQSRDMGRCSAEQKDGKRCKSWVDLRQGQVCEYHIHAAVSRGRAGRAEFTASTSSFALSTRGPNTKFNPQKKQGLLPNSGAGTSNSWDSGGGATYVVGGRAVHTQRSDGGLKQFGDEHIAEKLGSKRAEKRKRRMEEKQAEEALNKLLEMDGNNGSTGAKYLSKLVKSGKTAAQGKKGSDAVLEDLLDRKRPFKAGAIKRIGFDPTARPGQRDDEDQAKRNESIASLKDPGRPVKLGRPVNTSKTNVRVPFMGPVAKVDGEAAIDSDMIDLE